MADSHPVLQVTYPNRLARSQLAAQDGVAKSRRSGIRKAFSLDPFHGSPSFPIASMFRGTSIHAPL